MMAGFPSFALSSLSRRRSSLLRHLQRSLTHSQQTGGLPRSGVHSPFGVASPGWGVRQVDQIGRLQSAAPCIGGGLLGSKARLIDRRDGAGRDELYAVGPAAGRPTCQGLDLVRVFSLATVTARALRLTEPKFPADKGTNGRLHQLPPS